MEMIYPKQYAQLFIPRQLDGSPGNSVFEVAHQNTATPVYWHLNGIYLGSTIPPHKIPVNPGEGQHKLTLIDGTGEVLERYFKVVSK